MNTKKTLIALLYTAPFLLHAEESINDTLSITGDLKIVNGEEATIRSSLHSLSFRGLGYAHRGYHFYPGESTSGNTWSHLSLFTADTNLNFEEKIKLHTAGDSYINGGNVGIGTIAPGALLNVGTKSYNQNSTIAMFGKSVPSGEAQVLSLVNSGGGSGQSTSISFHNNSSWSETGKIEVNQVGTSTTSEMRFHTYNSGVKLRMLIDSIGNVGIGTLNTGSAKLSVAGTIRAEEVVVETGWSDFVFEEDYKLRSLDEVENHIAEYGHLPDVPSAQEVESEGLSVGETQKIMMQKIEELTLYVIDQQKEIEDLKRRLESKADSLP